MDNLLTTPYLNPNRPLPQLVGLGFDAIVDRSKGHWNKAPTPEARLRRYRDALALLGAGENHERREVHGVEQQDNLRAYGTTIDLRLLAQAMCRQDLAMRRMPAVLANAHHQARVLHLKGGRRG